LLERLPVDLIILSGDASSPEGLEASRLIREKEKHTGAHVPILALAAHTTRDDREACIGAGADACVSRSEQPAQLREAIGAVLAAKTGESAAHTSRR
jgi:CheY-like chemotaxis protein